MGKLIVDRATLAAGAATEATLASILAAVDQLEGYTDGIEALLTALNTYVDGLEGNTDDIETLLTNISGYVDQLEGFTDGIEGLITSLNGFVDGLETLIGSTNTKLDTLIADLTGSSSATMTNVDVTAVVTTLLAANSARKMATFFNDGGGNVYLKFGSSASLTSFSVRLEVNALYELPTPVYKGIITAIAGSGTRTIRVTEY